MAKLHDKGFINPYTATSILTIVLKSGLFHINKHFFVL